MAETFRLVNYSNLPRWFMIVIPAIYGDDWGMVYDCYTWILADFMGISPAKQGPEKSDIMGYEQHFLGELGI